MDPQDWLEHILNEEDYGCTGDWELYEEAGNEYLRCNTCTTTHFADYSNHLRASEENVAGLELRRLTAEGIAQTYKK